MPVQGICAVNLASHSQATRACCDWGLLVSRATMCLEALKQGFAAMSTNQDESASVIELDGVTPFASGDNRLCFRHPNHPDRCIKVLREGRASSLHASSPFYKRAMREAYFDDNRREYRAYQQPAIVRGNVPYDRHIAHCFGWVKTTLGDGLVTDFVANSADMPAQTLEAYVGLYGLDEPVRKAVGEFCEFLRRSLVLTKNLMPHNLVLAEEGEALRLVLIDGLGLSTVLPLAKHIGYFARRHVEKRIQWLNFRLEWEVSDRSVSWRETEKRFRFRGVPLAHQLKEI
ncbi:MAG: hypothetical protein CMP97_11650 [Gammaproteobacteria bacterium]|nr:hypothetical protein [Gammaproteobacteria bacterium]